MLRKCMATILVVFSVLSAQAQEKKVTLSGYIRDAANGEELIGATVLVSSTNTGSTANLYGFYSISMPAGSYDVIYSYVGYESKTITVDLSAAQTMNVELTETSQALGEVEISAERADANVTSTEMSTVKVEMNEIKKLPAPIG